MDANLEEINNMLIDTNYINEFVGRPFLEKK